MVLPFVRAEITCLATTHNRSSNTPVKMSFGYHKERGLLKVTPEVRTIGPQGHMKGGAFGYFHFGKAHIGFL